LHWLLRLVLLFFLNRISSALNFYSFIFLTTPKVKHILFPTPNVIDPMQWQHAELGLRIYL
jgi:hypothetical protein